MNLAHLIVSIRLSSDASQPPEAVTGPTLPNDAWFFSWTFIKSLRWYNNTHLFFVDASIPQTPIMAATSYADEAVVPRSVSKVQEIPKRKWTSYIWDTFDKSPEERRLLFKLDTAILTFASLGNFPNAHWRPGSDLWLTPSKSGYFIKYLDQVNINNAFVSGM